MKNKKEHILALKISILLFLFAFLVSYWFQYISHNVIFWLEYKKWFHRYFILIFISIFIYFISYYFAKKTFEPIKKVNESLKEYNHNLAHELKTPLSVIKSDLELLEMWKKLDFDIIKSTKQEIIFMQEIIDSLLFLSEKQVWFEKKEINLEKFIKDFIKYNYDNDIFKMSKKNNTKIKVNEKLFTILLKNLLENARKYWDLKEKIEILIDKNFLEIKNKIAKNTRKIDTKKIFDAFYKWDNSRTGEGYWLGLNIVKKIVELHNYIIKVEIKNDFFIVIIRFVEK